MKTLVNSENGPKRQKVSYPNFPDEFRVLAKQKRLEMRMSQGGMAKALGCHTANISQLERGDRNYSYEMALKVRDFLEMNYDLPEPTHREAPVFRARPKMPDIIRDRLFVILEGELIEVLSHRRLGRIQEVTKLSK